VIPDMDMKSEFYFWKRSMTFSFHANVFILCQRDLRAVAENF